MPYKDPLNLKERNLLYRKEHKEYLQDYDRTRRNNWARLQYKNSAEYRLKAIEYVKTRRADQRLLCLSHYSNGRLECACCKETCMEFLSIDHINGGGNKHRQSIGGSGNSLFQWLIKNGFPEGYRVLCYNCNCSLGYYGFCPHSRLIPQEITR